MKFFKLKIIKNNWTKLLSVFFFVLLFSSYIYTFAIGQPYAPGTTLDPSCAPGETNCTVLVIPDQSANIGKFLTTDGTGTFWDSITESDPVFTASSASGITNTDISTWNAKQDALGFIPYDSTNPSNYISGITSGDVTTALGFNPYDSTNPDGYISAINSGMVTTALGFTPLASESDPVFVASTAHGITGTDITNWNAKQNALTNPITGTGTSGQVSFWNGTNTQTGDNGLFWDDTNKRLGVGTVTPGYSLDVNGYARFTTPGGAFEMGITDPHAISRNVQTAFILQNNATTNAAVELRAGPGLNGVGRLMVNSTGNTIILGGNVGIANLTPGSRLTIKGTGTTSATSSLNVTNSADTSALFVRDDSNVGIGTTTPSYKLDVQGGQINASGGLCIGGVCQASWPAASPWITSGNNIYNNNSANVGIGTTTPSTILSLGNSQNQTVGIENSTDPSVLGRTLTLKAGGTTNTGNADFLPLNQTGRIWQGMTVAPNGNVYASVNGGDIYMQTGGTGNFMPLGQTSRAWYGMAAAQNGNIYAAVYGGDIYMQTGGAGNFVSLGQTSRNWTGMAATPNGNIYAAEGGGDIYMQTGGTGNFIALSQTPRSWTGMAAAPNGNVYASVWSSSDYIYMQTGGVGNFVIVPNSATYGWQSMAAATNGNIYAGTHWNGGVMYMQTSGAGNFVSLNQTSRAWDAMAAAPNGNVYAATYNGDIYMQTAVAGTTDLVGGNLVLQSGVGKGAGTSNILFQTGTTLSSGTTLQTLSTKMSVLGNGNVGINTTTPGYKLDVQGGQINASGGLCIAGVCQAIWPTPGFTLPSLTSGSILFSNGTTISQDNSNFFWDNTNKRLGLGTTTPSTDLSFGTGNRTIQIDPKSYGAGSNLYINAQTTAGGGSPFTAQGAGSRAWQGVSVNSVTGDIWATVYGGDVYKNVGGTGSFVAQSLGVKNWRNVAVNPTTGDVWAVENGGDIYKSVGGTVPFVAQSAGTQYWYGVTVHPTTGDVWVAINGGDIYKNAGGTGSFVAQSAGNRAWRGVSVNPTTGDIWAIANGGDVYKNAGGTGSFVAQSAGTRAWQGISVNPTTGDVWAITNGGDIYKSAGGIGPFVSQSAGNMSWTGISVNITSGDIWASVIGGDIYKQTVGINQSGGNLLLSSGSGTGNSPNYLSFTTSTPTVSGSTQQTLSEKMRILGDGNIGINTTTPGYKLDVQGGQINASGGLCIAGVCQTSWSALTSWTTSGNDIYNSNTGNVGIGTSTPNNKIQVVDLIDFNNTDFNTKLGYQAGKNIVTGATNNTFVGYQSGLSNSTLSTITAIGNTAIGYQSFYSNTTGYNNTANGYLSLFSNTTGYQNVAVGYQSLFNNTTGGQNIAVGLLTLSANTTGNTNVALGHTALRRSVSGNGNVAVGGAALYQMTLGSNNTAVGGGALTNITSSNNVGVGANAGGGLTSGGNNTAIGLNSLITASTGAGNVVIGNYSGAYEVGSNSFYVNNINQGSLVNDQSYSLLYGKFSGVTGSLTGQKLIVNGNLGISTLTPTARLHLPAGSATASTAPLKFTSGPLLTTTEAGAIEFLNDDYYATISNGAGSSYASIYPPAQSDTYVQSTTHYFATQTAYSTTDPANSVTGAWTNQWLSANGSTTNQRFHIDLGVSKVITRIYYENSHHLGGTTQTGVRNFTLWGSNDPTAFSELTYGIDTNWTQITTASSQFLQHVSSDVADPHYITLTNSTSYRYYAFKFADDYGGTSMGVRRIELQEGGTGDFTARKGIVLTNGTSLVSGRIPYSYTNGRLIDTTNFVFDGSKLGLGLSTPSYKLEVKDNTASYTTKIWNDGDSSSNSGLLIQSGLYDQSLAGPSTLIGFNDGDGTPVGSITFGSNATSYNTASDERLKENIGDTTLSLDTLNQIKIHDFSWKSDSNHNIYHGVLAQELQLIYPQAVMVPTNPDDSWMVDYSKLTPLIVKSIQDLDLRVKGIETISEDSTFTASLKTWLASATNGIMKLFVKEIETESICVPDENGGKLCLDKQELFNLIKNAKSTTGSSVIAPVEDTTPTPTPEVSPVAETPVVEQTPVPETTPVVEVPVVEQTPAINEPVVETPAPTVEPDVPSPAPVIDPVASVSEVTPQ